MDKMDSSNGIAWFENIFQKFEDMYHDVDELMKQVLDLFCDEQA